ncbi:hypothetical protein Tbis_1951 [Thermobispora bispora DSM 43833]|uniref:Uncharacterized protein n=1 Tax=Thermobispora bispora (strain ATCC 19993 / DSM 43833 / CBS 139.67 / JCM 10125 / KCTC 9307 / NBRC 14880 / R51) TaxID=469371 RepID=D6Y1Q7_THEBD|nr:hypothetical protein Tbis_1951 [Thermobispora bispora DSM 43833]MBO2474601.1 hypothetical protein [Actinomycetales bacterium]
MVKRIATTMVAVAVGATALAATAPAYADGGEPAPAKTARHGHPSAPRILSFEVTPNPVVVKGFGSASVTAKVTALGAKSVAFELSGPKGARRGDGRPGKRLAPFHSHGPVTFSTSWTFTWRDAGTWRVSVVVTGADGKRQTAVRYLTVKRDRVVPKPPVAPKPTRIVGFDAAPEPVRAGRPITLRGKLQVARCYGGWYYRVDGNVAVLGRTCPHDRPAWYGWYRLGGQKIDVYFRAKGSRHWKHVDTVKTRADGSFSAKVRALRSGTWTVKFDGTRFLKGSSASDYVPVYR